MIRLMQRLKRIISNADNRNILTFAGPFLVTIVGGCWAVFVHFDQRSTPRPIVQILGGVQVGGANQDAEAHENLKMDAYHDSLDSLVKEVSRLRATIAFIGSEEWLRRAIADLIAKSTHERRYRSALELLKLGDVRAAIPLIKDVAEDKQSLAKDNLDAVAAAVAYSDLAAIAGLIDIAEARNAYQQAIALDPENSKQKALLNAFDGANSVSENSPPSPVNTPPIASQAAEGIIVTISSIQTTDRQISVILNTLNNTSRRVFVMFAESDQAFGTILSSGDPLKGPSIYGIEVCAAGIAYCMNGPQAQDLNRYTYADPGDNIVFSLLYQASSKVSESDFISLSFALIVRFPSPGSDPSQTMPWGVRQFNFVEVPLKRH